MAGVDPASCARSRIAGSPPTGRVDGCQRTGPRIASGSPPCSARAGAGADRARLSALAGGARRGTGARPVRYALDAGRARSVNTNQPFIALATYFAGEGLPAFATRWWRRSATIAVCNDTSLDLVLKSLAAVRGHARRSPGIRGRARTDCPPSVRDRIMAQVRAAGWPAAKTVRAATRWS